MNYLYGTVDRNRSLCEFFGTKKMDPLAIQFQQACEGLQVRNTFISLIETMDNLEL